jgi:hypothetical protein
MSFKASKKLLVCFPLFLSLFLFSCWNDTGSPISANIPEIDGSGWAALRDDAHAAFAAANAEFYKGIPSSADVMATPKSLQELAPPPPDGVDPASINWNNAVVDPQVVTGEPVAPGLREQIITLAFQAYSTGDTTVLMQFLSDNGLSEKYHDILDRYNIDMHAKNLASRPKSKKVSAADLKSPTYIGGDIFLCYQTGSSSSTGTSSSVSGVGMLIAGKWKHSGFLDYSRKDRVDGYSFLSASNKVQGGGSKVGYESYDQWSNETEVSILRVRNSSAAVGQNAVNYSSNYIGKPFSFLDGGAGGYVSMGAYALLTGGLSLLASNLSATATPRSADDYWYCSKLVYRGWLSQGRELETHNDWSRKLVFWRWKGIIPQFRWVDIPDQFITPTDISNDDDISWIGGDPK